MTARPPRPHRYLRVLVHERSSGAWNMAVDDALLSAPDAGWVLRFYAWDRPTVSIGYGQPLQRALDGERARRAGIPVVRRPTGGRAVLHADEITYAIIAPADAAVLAGGISASYRRIATGLQRGLARLGAAVDVARSGAAPSPEHKGACFGARARYEIVAGGRKMVGSAQRRRGEHLLQHGSLLLGAPQPRLWAVLGPGADEALASSVGLVELLGRRPSRRALVTALAEALAAELGLAARRARLTRAERRCAARAWHRYRSAAWTRRR